MNVSLLIAAIELIAPAPNATVPLIPDCQRAVITNETRVQRQAMLETVAPDGKKWRKHGDWRKAMKVEFKWRATEGEKEPWTFSIAKRPDFSDARIEYIGAITNAEHIARYALPRANLEIATRYYWRVESKKSRAEGSFVTEDLAPRWIEVEGRVKNFRDLGGRVGMGGRRVRQGMIYRSQGLNDNSIGGKRKGRNRLMIEDVHYLTRTLGIKTDLDLRTTGETANMTESPMGSDINFINHPSPCYARIFEAKGQKTMAENFRVFCDERNYPILFHCIGGADRTGALGYVLNGVLGVERQELETDWESTFYPTIPFKDKSGKYSWNSAVHFETGFAKYGAPGDSWNRRIELYLLDCGITPAEIETLRRIMLK